MLNSANDPERGQYACVCCGGYYNKKTCQLPLRPPGSCVRLAHLSALPLSASKTLPSTSLPWASAIPIVRWASGLHETLNLLWPREWVLSWGGGEVIRGWGHGLWAGRPAVEGAEQVQSRGAWGHDVGAGPSRV